MVQKSTVQGKEGGWGGRSRWRCTHDGEMRSYRIGRDGWTQFRFNGIGAELGNNAIGGQRGVYLLLPLILT
jgi:hypothetical protein